MTDSYVPHRFNPQVAQLYGIPAALIFQFISYCCDKHKLDFLPLSVSELATRYPYLDRRTVGRVLDTLVFPGKGNPNPALLVRKKLNGVWHYHPVTPDEKFALHVFDARVAIEHGVIPAIILQNIGHWVRHNWKRKAEQALTKLKPEDYDHDLYRMHEDALVFTANGAAHTISIEEWLERHTYTSYRTAVRGFSCLRQAGLIFMRRGKHNKPIWVLSRDLRADYAEKMLKLSTLENTDANLPTDRIDNTIELNELQNCDAKLPNLLKSVKKALNSSTDSADDSLKLSELQNCDAKLPNTDAILGNTDATLGTKQGLTSTPTNSYNAYVEDSIDEDKIAEYGDGFAGSSLAALAPSARSASKCATASPAVPAELHELNQPSYKRTRKKRQTEKRSYIKHPEPDTEDFEIWFDDLTPDQRREYLASRR
jgi:hypothetical protein